MDLVVDYCLDCVVCPNLIPQTPLYVKSQRISLEHIVSTSHISGEREGGKRILALSPAVEIAPGILRVKCPRGCRWQ